MGIVIGLVILSAVVAGGIMILKTRQKSQENNTFELSKVKVGDTIGNMKIISIKPFADKLVDKLKPEANVIIKFSGEAMVSGRYGFDYEFLGANLLVLDNDSRKKLPALLVGGSQIPDKLICLSDPNSKVDYKKGGEGTFIIDYFVLVSYPSEGCSSAGVVKVLKTAPLPPEEVITIESPYGVVEVDLDDLGVGNGQRWMLIRNLASFEGERGAEKLHVIDVKNKTSKTIDNISGAILLNNKTALISKFFLLESSGQNEFGNLDPNFLAKAASEIQLDEKEILSRVYPLGGKPVAVVNALFELDLETGTQTSLRLFGGQGGIFRTQDKTIYLSNNHTTNTYKGFGSYKDGGALFGTSPYMIYDPISKKLIVTRLPDGFPVGFGKVFRPLVLFASNDAQLASGGIAGKPIIFSDNIYVVFEWPYLREF